MRVKHRGRREPRPLKMALLCGAAAVLIAAAVRCGRIDDKRGEYIGRFDLSHYCLETWNEYHSCGNSEYGCEGDRLRPGVSLAVPGSVLEKYPVGTRVLLVYPDGRQEERVIEDTGAALEELNRIDLPVKTHDEALELGVISGVKMYTLRESK